MAPQSILVELFADYIRLRQVGYASDAAWQALRPRIVRLGEQDVARLHALLRGWEAREGRHYQVAGSLNATPEHPDERVERVRTLFSAAADGVRADDEQADRDRADYEPAHDPLPAYGRAEAERPASKASGAPPVTIPVERGDRYEQKKHLIRRIEPSPNVPPPGTLCPVCMEANRPGEIYCVHCGCLLTSATVTPPVKAGQTRPVTQPAAQGSYFDDTMTLQIKVRGATEPLRVTPRPDTELVLGRMSLDSVVVPDVDLTPFNAQAFGVSRLHATLSRHEDTVVISDMGSLNYTFVNGQRLIAQEKRVLSDGDEIRLGHLTMQVYFRRAAP